jgi:hypothetical protein
MRRIDEHFNGSYRTAEIPIYIAPWRWLWKFPTRDDYDYSDADCYRDVEVCRRALVSGLWKFYTGSQTMDVLVTHVTLFELCTAMLPPSDKFSSVYLFVNRWLLSMHANNHFFSVMSPPPAFVRHPVGAFHRHFCCFRHVWMIALPVSQGCNASSPRGNMPPVSM